MRRIHTVIIGGGQAGLAMSRCLSERGLDHVVLERGRVGERWRSQRWDSLRLLTPNWMSRLPGWQYRGSEPDEFMTLPEMVTFLKEYSRSFEAPVEEGTEVRSVDAVDSKFRVETSRGTWEAENVVIATGHCDKPYVPSWGREIGNRVLNLTPNDYRNPDGLPERGVLIVGASSTGIQLADEILSSGRPVTLAVGRHTRLPRNYRGRDIFWWFERLGILNQRPEDVYDLSISRDQPSLQLVGRPDHSSLDLPALQRKGVRLVGRAEGVEGGSKFLFDDNLVAYTVAADVKLAQLLERIDRFISRNGLEEGVTEADKPVPFFWPETPPSELDLSRADIGAVLWATGFRREYSWLKVPVLDARGEIRHRGGITSVPGLYVLGLQFLRRRSSAFIDGVGKDARELTEHLVRRGNASSLQVA